VNICSTAETGQYVNAKHNVFVNVACRVRSNKLHTVPAAAACHCTCKGLTAVMLFMLCSLEEFIKYYERLAR
jgi:hypothetical protein